MTQEQFNAALLVDKSKFIDEAVTKEEGDTLKITLKTNQANCTGNFCKGNINSNKTGNFHGNGGGLMGFQ